uniref:Matrin-type domain-containing protein n=1 Tax=Setaria digitata TaxID=48799 RepID=A0A915PMY1_9BILA
MTDVWKSNARKFCEICKVWFADNRVSIEHHESGQKHKAAIQAKLRELGKKSKQKEKEVTAFEIWKQRDLQATLAMMESAANKKMGISDSCPSAGVIGPMPKPKKYMDPRASGASVAEVARVMAKRKKEMEMEKMREEFKAENKELDPENETVWVEAKAESDTPYYFHMHTGVTMWTPPQKYYTMEQYAMKLAMMESSDEAAVNRATEPHATSDLAAKRDLLETKIEHGTEMDASNHVVNECDIPLPPSSQAQSLKISFQDLDQEKRPSNLTVKEELFEDSSCNEVVQDDASSTRAEGVDDQSDKGKIITKKNVEPGPYGPWVPVEKAIEKPKIDWELPTEEQGRKRVSEPALAPDDIITFDGKKAAVKRKKIDGPIEFRKRKAAIKTRQPIDDQ